jgi:F-type H+-transporting ATPase subunit b
MEETLRHLGELLLASIPTIIALLVVWGAYRVIVYSKLTQVLAERHSLTEGAIQKAQAEIASAEARTAEYEEKVREAKAEIYKTQEAYRGRVIEQRNSAIAQARQQAEEMVKSARASAEQDVAAAKATLGKQAEGLAEEIIQSILRPAMAAGGR